MFSLAKTAAISVLAVPFFVSSPAVAAPASYTDGPCQGSSGVTVVVDATHFAGAKVTRRCVAGDPETAFEALSEAGFSPVHGTGQGQQGPYQYLCRIDARPSTSADPCTGFVANAPYWAYWVPDAQNASWTYAEEGVDTSDPAPGTVLGFSFGAGTATDPNQMSLTLAQAKDPNWTGS
ncbi:hypothetical protein [Amycolatopsis silviterrae]|uniref:DUF4360 domain-containing protein n=1 Tax=Amycolatopsis silviterrae TaxID=1656914 RepID=A0ABW5HP08_9PSEU